ncbi:hypothetical protein KT99_06567 [Shewanella benthica KT99]|uniref:ABM domain-containing protein n=2 Tax=Shewanella benthica TaxID=43661 RepID=A9CV74_9GAMM|nr:antibiotic biosynthesis monooxygenase [Shewanella benthica]EDQ02808.1 hypothetical protein KT99_06567 [Shewanella benthica KT99]
MAVALQDKENPRRFIFWERYEDKAAFEQHFQAEHTQRFINSGLTDLVQAFETQLLIWKKRRRRWRPLRRMTYSSPRD